MAQPDVEEVPLRTGATADMAAVVLAEGELGLDLTTRQLRVGDGTTAFADLSDLTPTHVDVVLVAGTKTTADTKIKATSRVVPVVHTLGTVAAPKTMRVTLNAGVSFVVTSEDATDTSTVRCLVWH